MLEYRLGTDHAALHGGVVALDLGHVEEASSVADNAASREGEPGDRLEPTGRQCPCTVADATAPFQVPADLRMGLETLEFVEGGKIRILVVEPDHEPDRDLVVGRVVHPRPAVGPAVHW